MSLADLTRNSFQSGLSASKWLGLCKLFIAKDAELQNSGNVPDALSNSVLSVLRFYPGDPDLQEYLKCAIQDGLLSLASFVSTLLQAARSPDLHNPATLDMLCRIALDAHYASGLTMTIGSIVPIGESAIVTLGTVQDALALLRTAHSLPISHFHQLTTSVSELVILLLGCVSDMSQVSTTQAMVHFADANDLLLNFRLSPDVRQVLETFMLSLSLLIGDDAKAAREAQMMHSLQVALGKGDVLGSNSSTDIVSFGLLLQSVILQRARPFGSGSSTDIVALFVGAFQWSSWPAPVFYTQLFITALIALAQSPPIAALLWRDFILGRLPPLLISFEQELKDSQVEADWRAALQAAMTTVAQRNLASQCDHVLASAGPDAPSSPIFPELLHRLVTSSLLDELFAESMGVASMGEWKTNELITEANSLDITLEAYIDSKISAEVPPYEDLYALVDRICKDPVSHAPFASVVRQRFVSLSATFDVEALSRICKVLYIHNRALDILSLHASMEELLAQTLVLVDRYDCETIGDPQTAVTHLGDIVLFTQHALAHFNMDTRVFNDGNKMVSPKFLQSTRDVFPPESLSSEDALAFNAWFKTLFDSSNEGIEDTILRASRPKTLLKISASLFFAAIKARAEGKIDADVLNNGISFFTGPLLSWVTIGVVKALLKEIHRKGFRTPIHLEVLQTLLLSPSCPKPVLVVCGSQILAVLASKAAKEHVLSAKLDKLNIERVVAKNLGQREVGYIQRALTAGAQSSWQDYPRQIISNALAMARTDKIPYIDVDRLVKTTTPTKLVQTLWSEMATAASKGETENCRRIATFVLTSPPNPNSPPLLPIFLHRALPSIILSVDALETTNQTTIVELLVILVSSVLTAALQLELALRGSQWENRSVLGEPIISMAKRLSIDLRSMEGSYTATAIVQRLGSAQSFVSNFPVFMGEIGTSV